MSFNVTTNVQDMDQGLKQLKLKGFQHHYMELAQECEKGNKTHISYLCELVNRELEERSHRRIEKLIRGAKLPRQKCLRDFEVSRIPGLTRITLEKLSQGDFIDRCENLLLFGNPGTGKTHLCLALAENWCLLGRKVFYISAAALMQELLKAKEALKLNEYIKRLDRYEMLIIDDISYVPCERKETDVMFNLLSSRYEMRSIMITSNIPFSKWDQIFKDQMTTAAAIDRLVHHSTIIELNAESYRIKKAQEKTQKLTQEKEKDMD